MLIKHKPPDVNTEFQQSAASGSSAKSAPPKRARSTEVIQANYLDSLRKLAEYRQPAIDKGLVRGFAASLNSAKRGPYKLGGLARRFPGLSKQTLTRQLQNSEVDVKSLAVQILIADAIAWASGYSGKPISRAGLTRLTMMTEAERQGAKAWAIRAIDHDEVRATEELRRSARCRMAKGLFRAGGQSREKYLADIRGWDTKPEGMSRATWYRHLAKERAAGYYLPKMGEIYAAAKVKRKGKRYTHRLKNDTSVG